MRRILMFALPILITVTVGFAVFGMLQVRVERDRMLDDLTRKAQSIAESMELSVREAILERDIENANYLAETFEARERLQGCVIYDTEGEVIAITRRFSDWPDTDRPQVIEAMSGGVPVRQLLRFREHTLYSYILPISDGRGATIGSVEIIHDTSYVFNRLTQLWRRISITLAVLVVLILLLSVMMHRQAFVLPVQRLTEWFHHFQRGEMTGKAPIKGHNELGKLATEVEQIALKLRVAQRRISVEATQRLEHDQLWTEAKLRDTVHARLGDNPLIVVSNREPYMHVIDDATGKPRCIRPASGVVTAIHPIMCACGGTWIAHGSGKADRQFVNSRDKLGVPPDDNRYILKRVWLTKQEEEGYYYGFSNEGLWPLCHNTHTRPTFRETDWNAYWAANQKFANAVLEELPLVDPFVFIQDYHFTLLPRMIKEQRPDATIALFWHIPWPTPEAFSICPWQKEILEGMLGCDLIGFHVQNQCNNFLDTANRLLESKVDTERFSVVRVGKETFVRAFPISVDTMMTDAAAAAAASVEIESLRQDLGLEGMIVGVGVDRIDYTKGIVERLLAIDRFMEKYPQYRGKFVFVQLAAPSRTHIKRYHDLMGEVDELVERINWKHMDEDWKPILYLKRHFSQEEIRPFYGLADLCIVSSLHDGMNLVSKEFVAARWDSSGVLVLSQFTGASRELTDAVLVNPYSIEDFADAIKSAVEMPAEEKTSRMGNMRRAVSENNIYRWAADIMTEFTALKKTQFRTPLEQGQEYEIPV